MQREAHRRMLHLDVLILILALSTCVVTTTSVPGTTSECRHIYNTTRGQIFSPNFPDDYPSYTQCDYFIRPHLNQDLVIRLQPKHFQLEGGYDQIEVREMEPHGPFIGKYSGNLMPILYAKSFWLRFTSDHSISRSGFNIEWRVSDSGIRLVNGTNPMEGRVEVFHNSTWGTICDDDWSSPDAITVCLMMGLKETFALAFSQAIYGRGTGKIWLDNVACHGNETSLFNCPFPNPWGKQNCNHKEDAGIRCPASFELSNRIQSKRQSFPKGCGGYYDHLNGSIASPLLSVYPNNAHCEYNILPTPSATNVTRLAFQAFDLEKGADFLEIREEGPNGALLGRFTGDRLPPVFYAKRFWLMFTSDNSRTGRGFQAQWSSTNTGLRLRNGTWFGEGRVELFYSKRWGTVCDDGWNSINARIICSMLGYTGEEVTAVLGGRYGEGKDPIYLDNVACFGNETDIMDCSHSRVYQHDCAHSEDAGVICGSSTMDYGSTTRNEMDKTTKAAVKKAVNIACGSMKFTVSINLASLKSLFPFLAEYRQYFSLVAEECRGVISQDGSRLVFNSSLGGCGMVSSESEDSIVFHNTLLSHPNLTEQISIFRTGLTLSIPLECSLSKEVVMINKLKPFHKRIEGDTIKGYGNFSAKMDFYKDALFASMIYDYPAYVHLGQKLGVELILLTNLKHLKLVMQDCKATTSTDSSNNNTSSSYYLIQNRCPVDSTTTFVEAGQLDKFRFLFKTFEFIRKQSEVYIICNLLVCNDTDQSTRCSQICTNGTRHTRSVDQSKSDIHVIQGPLVFKDNLEAPTNDNKISAELIIGMVVAVVAVMFIIAVVMAVKSRKKADSYSPPYSEYEMKTEKVAMLDFD